MQHQLEELVIRAHALGKLEIDHSYLIHSCLLRLDRTDINPHMLHTDGHVPIHLQSYVHEYCTPLRREVFCSNTTRRRLQGRFNTFTLLQAVTGGVNHKGGAGSRSNRLVGLYFVAVR